MHGLRTFLLVGLIGWLGSCVSVAVAQTANQSLPLSVEVSSAVQGALRAGAAGEARVTLTNLLPARHVILSATAVYEHAGQQRTATSNEVRISIDDSITVRQLRLRITNLSNIAVVGADGRSINFTVNGGEVIVSDIVVGQAQPTVIRVTGNVAIANQ